MFDKYFTEIYGGRWAALREAIKNEPSQGLYKNPFVETQNQCADQRVDQRVDGLKKLNDELWMKEPLQKFSPERTESGLLDFYVMDPASFFVAKLLDVQPGQSILDMCAAPGGKSLVLFSGLKDEGLLISNDVSPDRRFRMKKIFEQYIPHEPRQRIHIRGWDGLQFGMRNPESYDRVLLDAPCSGERHMMESEKEIQEWKPKRAESLAKRQYGLLTSALLTVRPGGFIVYSTCSINPAENDEVIDRLLDRKGDQFELVSFDTPPDAEKTKHGVQFLPDRCGYGPMFCCKIRKHEGLSSNRT